MSDPLISRPVTAQFDFGVDFQRALLRLCMVDPAFAHHAMKHLNEACFTTEAHGWIFKVAREHYTKYQLCLTDTMLWEAVRYAAQGKQALLTQEVYAMLALGHVQEREWLKAKLVEFVQRAYFVLAHRESQLAYNEGKPDAAYDVMGRAVDQIRTIDFGNVDRHWYGIGFEERQRMRRIAAMNASQSTFSTGIEGLDACLNGGISLGEVLCILAFAKSGKTVWLINQGYNAVKMHAAPTLHVNLEGSTQLVSDRYDARWSGELYTQVKQGHFGAQTYAYMLQEMEHVRRLLVIRTINSWDVNVLDIDAELRELKTLGFVPSVIILDYLDLLRSRERVDSETQHQNAGAKDVKRLANQGYAIWTAAQAQRPKRLVEDKQHLLRAADIADAYAKVRHIDGWGSINATPTERADGRARLLWEGYRDGPVGRVWELQNDFSRMWLAKNATPIQSSPEDAAANPGRSGEQFGPPLAAPSRPSDFRDDFSDVSARAGFR